MEEFITNQEKREQGQAMVKSLSEFMTAKGLSGADLRAAYLLALGLSPSDIGVEITGDIEELSGEIKAKFDDGLALNKVAELIFSIEKYENSVTEYFSLLDKIILTEKEKQILRSIVDKQRNGRLAICVSKSNLKIEELEFSENEQKTKQDLAIFLMSVLSKYKGLKGIYIEFSS